MKKGWSKGNKYAAQASQARWNARANREGFRDEKEMLETLIQEWSCRALGDLFGVTSQTIKFRLQYHGIKNPHGPGGANNTKVGRRQIKVMRKMHEFCDYVFALEEARGA